MTKTFNTLHKANACGYTGKQTNRAAKVWIRYQADSNNTTVFEISRKLSRKHAQTFKGL